MHLTLFVPTNDKDEKAIAAHIENAKRRQIEDIVLKHCSHSFRSNNYLPAQ